MQAKVLKRSESEESIKINLGMEIKNFGPISNASISIKPLTIFIGPNNSGKSYVSTLIHSIVSSYGMLSRTPLVRSFRSKFSHSATGGIHRDVEKLVKQLMTGNNIAVPSSLTGKISQRCYDILFLNTLPNEIRRNFGSSLDDLTQFGSKSFFVKLRGLEKISLKYAGTRFAMPSYTRPKFQAKLVYESSIDGYPIRESIDKDDTVVYKISRTLDPGHLSGFLLHFLHKSIISKMSVNIPHNSHYFPASRSGILQGHRAISASIVRNAHYGGIEQIQIPKLTGVVSDFISSIIELPNPKGCFFNFAESMEKELLHGRINMSSATKVGLSEIKYRYLEHDMSLHNTSSTISELAPFILYLKYIVKKGDMLIIEEPEAHLHPGNQLTLAKYIVRMIRAGLNVLVTTHSVFLLEALSQYLQAGSISPDARRKNLKFGKNDYLLSDEISPYVFVNASEGSNTVKPIDFSAEDGISQDEFLRIDKVLHDLNIQIMEAV